MLDFDLAVLYQVQTKVLYQAVKRNLERFPDRFMFRFIKIEWNEMRSQIVTVSYQNKINVYLSNTELKSWLANGLKSFS